MGGDKRLRDLHWLVCWDVGTSHEREGVELVDVTGESQRNQRYYYGQTHLMRDVTGVEVHVIALRKVIELVLAGQGGGR